VSLIQETEFHPDKDPVELRAVGQALTLKYLDEACPSIEPAAVELPITGESRWIELKGAARKPSEVRPDASFPGRHLSGAQPAGVGPGARARTNSVGR